MYYIYQQSCKTLSQTKLFGLLVMNVTTYFVQPFKLFNIYDLIECMDGWMYGWMDEWMDR